MHSTQLHVIVSDAIQYLSYTLLTIIPSTMCLIPCSFHRVPNTVVVIPCTFCPAPCIWQRYHVPCVLYLVVVPCTLYYVLLPLPGTMYLVPCSLYLVVVPCILYPYHFIQQQQKYPTPFTGHHVLCLVPCSPYRVVAAQQYHVPCVLLLMQGTIYLVFCSLVAKSSCSTIYSVLLPVPSTMAPCALSFNLTVYCVIFISIQFNQG